MKAAHEFKSFFERDLKGCPFENYLHVDHQITDNEF